MECEHSSEENGPRLGPVFPEMSNESNAQNGGKRKELPKKSSVGLPDFLAVLTHFSFVENSGFLQVLNLKMKNITKFLNIYIFFFFF